MTFFDLLQWGISALAQASDEPETDAWRCLEKASNEDKARLISFFKDPVPSAIKADFEQCIQARATGKPLAYVLGEAWFGGERFVIKPGVLIPRPETEVLVDTAVSICQQLGCEQIFELGFGSGIVSISLAKQLENARVQAWDLSASAVDVASLNAVIHQVEGIVWHHQDFFADTAAWRQDLTQDKPVLLVSNPPYIKRQEIAELAPQVKAFEPKLALDGGEDGLTFYKQLLPIIRANPNVVGVFEIGYDQADAMHALCADDLQLSLKEDMQGILRTAVIWCKQQPFAF